MSTPETRVFRESFYFTYPHNNAFCRDGHTLVLGRTDGAIASLWRASLASDKDIRLCEFDISREAEKLLWFDVAAHAERVVVSAGNALWLYDLNRPGSGDCLYRGESPAEVMSLPAISADGKSVVVGLKYPDRYAALLVEVESRRPQILFEQPWYANHYHFCPHDESWLGFCHEGATETIPDRVWAWHAEQAPQGRCLFDQHWGDPARELNVGHERWCFHDTTVLAVAYGVSPGEPRGIYEIATDGRAPKLLSCGNRHLHVNSSRSGRFVAIDTSGPHDLSGKGWENSNHISDVLLLNRATGEERWVARTWINHHPSHPHPTFSPDEKFVFFNEWIQDGGGNRIRVVDNPWL